MSELQIYHGDSRPYRHVACGGVTMAEGKTFQIICDPLMPLVQIDCDQCEAEIKLKDLAWADTGETLSDYRRRLRETLPGFVRAWAMGMGFAIGGIIGAIVVVILQNIYGTGKAGPWVFPIFGFFMVGFFFHIGGGSVIRLVSNVKTPRLH